MKSSGLFVIALMSTLSAVEACDGYKLKMMNIKNCGDGNQIVKISSNTSTAINDKCEVFSHTCADVKGYDSATALVTMRRNNMVIFNGTENLCQKQKKRSELAMVMMSACGLKCSMKQTSFCDQGNKVVTFDASKKLFPLVGSGLLNIRVAVKHDTGKSCFESDLSIYRD